MEPKGQDAPPVRAAKRRAIRPGRSVDLGEHALIPPEIPDQLGQLSGGRAASPMSHASGLTLALGGIPLVAFALVLFADLWREFDTIMIVFPVIGAVVAGLAAVRRGGSGASAVLMMVLAAFATATAVGAAFLLEAFLSFFDAF